MVIYTAYTLKVWRHKLGFSQDRDQLIKTPAHFGGDGKYANISNLLSLVGSKLKLKKKHILSLEVSNICQKLYGSTGTWGRDNKEQSGVEWLSDTCLIPHWHRSQQEYMNADFNFWGMVLFVCFCFLRSLFRAHRAHTISASPVAAALYKLLMADVNFSSPYNVANSGLSKKGAFSKYSLHVSFM